eukprot:9492300-Pyramimonas_sp.AAC.1
MYAGQSHQQQQQQYGWGQQQTYNAPPPSSNGYNAVPPPTTSGPQKLWNAGGGLGAGGAIKLNLSNKARNNKGWDQPGSGSNNTPLGGSSRPAYLSAAASQAAPPSQPPSQAPKPPSQPAGQAGGNDANRTWPPSLRSYVER